MATGTRLMQEISDQFLNCKICFENFRDPKTLSCLHTFCCDCLQQQYDSEASGRTSRYAIYSRSLTCPLCRQKTDLPAGGVRRLPDNFLVCNLKEVLAKRAVSVVPPCEICHSVRNKNINACSKCLDCCKLLCKACVEQHISTKVTQQHSLIDLEGEKNIECKVHPDENVRFYCEPCDMCICVVCTFKEHKDHEVCSFTDGFAKHKSHLESLLSRCKERMDALNTRLECICKHETSVKDTKEKIRDMTISYIAQVRSAERELIKNLEEEFGTKTQEFVKSKPVIQETADELQSACNLTDIMLKDKGLELLLLKKEMESKMVHLLDLSVPEMPESLGYNIRFVPGETVLGRLSFEGKDQTGESEDEGEKCKFLKNTDSNGTAVKNKNIINGKRFIDPDVLSNCTQTDSCRTREISTSMLADMTTELSHSNSQTDLTKTAIDELYLTAHRLAMDSRAGSGAPSNCSGMSTIRERQNEETPPPDLLPKSSLKYTPGRWIRSRKIQTDISSLDFLASRQMSDREYVHALLLSEQFQKQKQEQSLESVIVARDSSNRRKSDAETMTVQEATSSRQSAEISHMPFRTSRRHTSVLAVCDSCNADTQTPVANFKDAITCTDKEGQMERCTSTPSVVLIDRESGTPHVTCEHKTTWTELISTSERATSTISTQLRDRGIVTVAVKTGDVSFQAAPYTQNIATNTPLIDTSDAELQATVELSDRGTMPDLVIEGVKASKESCVDSLLVKGPTVTVPVEKRDQACDAFKPPSASKATDTRKVKLVSSATETFTPKFVDKEAATATLTTTDQWTETVSPQLISTGVTPPRPATRDVGVATVFIQTNDQASCTDVVAYRSSHTETMVTVCDNETLTERPGQADAQTSVHVLTDKAETMTDPISCSDQASNTELLNSPEFSRRYPTHATMETHTQTDLNHVYCSVCHQFNEQMMQLTHNGTEATNSNGEISSSSNTEADDVMQRFKEMSTKMRPSVTTEVGTMAMACVACEHNLHEAAIQTSTPLQFDKASSTSFDFERDDFLMRPLSREYHDVATSTESLPYIGLLSEIDVDELIVVPEAAFELVSDSDSDVSVPMVDSETCTDFLQLVEAGTQTFSGLFSDESQVAATNGHDQIREPMKESVTSQSGKSVGEIIRSMVQSEGDESMVWNGDDPIIEKGPNQPETSTPLESSSKHFASIGVNTVPKVMFEKETCTPLRHLFSKGTMTFYVSKMDKSTSTLSSTKVLGDSRLGNKGMVKTKSHDKITMTYKAEQKDVGVETEAAVIDGRIEKCISKLRNVSERLNSPTGRKLADGESFFGNNFSSTTKSRTEPFEQSASHVIIKTQGIVSEEPLKLEEERLKNLNSLLHQTTKPVVRPTDFVPLRKPQPITTLKERKPVSVKDAERKPFTGNSLIMTDGYHAPSGSRSLPRQFSLDRPRPVRMGSQPLTPSRLPLLRYNSAPGRIATVPSHTLLMKSQGSKSTSPPSSRLSPSKIPISKKSSPPEKISQSLSSPPVEKKIMEIQPTRPQIRHPLPSITETRTPSSCSDTSMTSYMSSSSAVESVSGPSSNRSDQMENKVHSGDWSSVSEGSRQAPGSVSTTMSTSLIEESKANVHSRPVSSATSSSLTTLNSEALSDNVFKKSSTDTIHSAASSETVDLDLENKTSTVSTASKKSGMGFMQRLLAKRKKTGEQKKGKPTVVTSGQSTGDAVKSLASAKPVPQGPSPESQAHGAQLRLPPHHYPPQPQPKSPPEPRKPRPFVYVRQRIFSIQQDNVEEVSEKKNTSPSPDKDKKPKEFPSQLLSPQQQLPPRQQTRVSPKPEASAKEKAAKDKTKERSKSKMAETATPTGQKQEGKSKDKKGKSSWTSKKRD